MTQAGSEPAPIERAPVDVQPLPSPSATVKSAVVAVTGLALFLGFWHLQRRSFWQDEAYTWSTVDRGFPALVSLLARKEGFQILHSLIEWPTNRLSSTVDAFRTPSVLAFAAAVPAVWLAGRRLFDERTGLLAALLFALNGFALQFAQQARGYMLAAALCAYAGAMLAGHVLSPRKWTRIGWIAFSALAIYAHGFAALGIAGQVAALWFLPAAKRRELHWLRDVALIGLCAAPAILAPLLQVNSTAVGVIAKPRVSDLRGLAWSMSGRTGIAVPVIGLGVVIALVTAANRVRYDLHSIDSFRFALPILWMIVPAFVLLTVSFVHPIYLERYVVWSVGAVVILAAYGLTRLGRLNGYVMPAVVLLAVAVASAGVVRWYRQPPEQDFHSAMSQLAPRVHAGDAFIFSPDEVRLPSDFYLRSEANLDSVIPVYPAAPWGHFKTGDQQVVSIGQAPISRVLAERYPRVWIVSVATAGVTAPRVDELSAEYRVASDHAYGGDVDVMLLELR
jgi:mannosyltransferase